MQAAMIGSWRCAHSLTRSLKTNPRSSTIVTGNFRSLAGLVKHTIPDDAPTHRLKRVFDQMKKSGAPPTAPLLLSWDAYENVLPVRKIRKGETWKLANLPYFATQSSIEKLAKQLEDCHDAGTNSTQRPTVAYLSASTGTGKTACVLPAFLDSVEKKREDYFSYYLYVAFRNNGTNSFESGRLVFPFECLSNDPEIQGAAFMYQCIKQSLDCKYGKIHTMNLFANDEPHSNIFQAALCKILQFGKTRGDVSGTTKGEITRRIDKLLDEKIPGDHRVLVHLDEYQKMNCNPHFRRGAMETLAMCRRVKCVATYTKPLVEVYPQNGLNPGVCRQPCPKPIFDLRAYLDKHHAIDISRLMALPGASYDQERKWETLAFRLAIRVQLKFPHSLVPSKLKEDDLEVKPWWQAIQAALDQFEADTAGMTTLNSVAGRAALDEALDKCCKETIFIKPVSFPTHHDDALELMNGIPENDFSPEYFKDWRVTPSLTIVSGRGIVATWTDLFKLEYKQLPAFAEASSCFSDHFKTNYCVPGTPLEDAYGWSLLSLSHGENELAFAGPDPPSKLMEFNIAFKAQDYVTGRLFRDATTNIESMVRPTELKDGVLYRAAEGKKAKDFLESALTTGQDAATTALPSTPSKPPEEKNLPTHPLCDFFFRTNDNKLVLVDITSGKDKASGKGATLDSWIKANEHALRQMREVVEIRGIVLAPFDKETSTTVYENDQSSTEEADPSTRQVLLVRGQHAIDLLGALGQLAEWFDADRLKVRNSVAIPQQATKLAESSILPSFSGTTTK